MSFFGFPFGFGGGNTSILSYKIILNNKKLLKDIFSII